MYSENQQQYPRRRSNDEFLRRMQCEEFLSRMTGEGDVPTVSRTDIPRINERPRANCQGTPLNENQSVTCHMPSLAMVYSPVQGWQNMLSPADGLAQGSIFAELIKPLEVGGANCPLGGGCKK